MLYSQSPPLADDDAAAEEAPHEFGRGRDARPEPQFGRRPAPSPAYAAPSRPSLGRRMFRALARFVIVVGIGVGGTLGWQAYGDLAKQMLAEHAPEQAWLLSYLPSTRPPAAVARAANPSLQLEPLASNLEFVRRSIEQLALKQEQMARSIVALQAVDEDIRQKIASPPPAPLPVAAQPAIATPQPKPAAPKPLPPPGAPASAAPRPAASAAPVSILPSR
jgi:hypothetical protein